MENQASGSRTTSPSKQARAAHLTEFYPYLNGGASTNLKSNSQLGQAYSTTTSTNASATPSIYNGKSSHEETAMSRLNRTRKNSLSTMASYTSFSPSTLDLQTLLTKTDIQETSKSYSNILEAAEQYKQSLLHVAEAAANFGNALENGAKCKGSGAAGDGLLNCSGLYFLISNHQQILAHTVHESFERPTARIINNFKLESAKNDELFKESIKEKVATLKKQEKENSKLSKLKSRNLVLYRSKLLQLTSYIDEIDKMKHDYYQSSFDLVQDTSNKILTQLGSIVRAQVEIYEGIARKGWSGGGLDDLISECPDPFVQEDDNELDNERNNELNILNFTKINLNNDDGEENRGAGAVDTVLEEDEPQESSAQRQVTNDEINQTPFIKSVPNSIKEDNESIVHSTPTKPRTAMANEQANDSYADDNSFSLPIITSRHSEDSKLTNTPDPGDNKEEEEENPPKEEKHKEEQNAFLEYPGHEEWQSPSGNSDTTNSKE